MQALTADEIKTMLNLAPLPLEGGFYFETYRAAGSIPQSALPPVYNGSRNYSLGEHPKPAIDDHLKTGHI